MADRWGDRDKWEFQSDVQMLLLESELCLASGIKLLLGAIAGGKMLLGSLHFADRGQRPD